MIRYSFVLLITCLLLQFAAHAINDSMITHRSFEGRLGYDSRKWPDGRYYSYESIHIDAGDMVCYVYTSSYYVPALFIQDSLGNLLVRGEDMAFHVKGTGSRIVMPFKAEKSGRYLFLFTTNRIGPTGNFSVDVFSYNRAADKISSNSAFCDKLKHILAHKNAGFEFIKGPKTEVDGEETYQSTIALFPDAGAFIKRQDGVDVYQCSWQETTDLKMLEQKYEKLAAQIKACLPSVQRKVLNKEMVTGAEQRTFVARTDFIRSGAASADMNALPAVQHMNYQISLRIVQSYPGKYVLELGIQ